MMLKKAGYVVQLWSEVSERGGSGSRKLARIRAGYLDLGHQWDWDTIGNKKEC